MDKPLPQHWLEGLLRFAPMEHLSNMDVTIGHSTSKVLLLDVLPAAAKL